MARLAITERLGRLAPRERRLVAILGGIFAFLVFIGLPVGLEAAVHSRRSEVDDLRAALEAVQAARGQVRERQAKKDSVTRRYAKRAPALAGLLEELARAQKLEVTDSVDRPDVPHGKKFTERSTTIHLKRSGMLPIAKFLESVETSGYAVTVSRLDIRRRAGEPDSYDVEVGVSAYDPRQRRAKGTAAARRPASSAGSRPGCRHEGATQDPRAEGRPSALLSLLPLRLSRAGRSRTTRSKIASCSRSTSNNARRGGDRS